MYVCVCVCMYVYVYIYITYIESQQNTLFIWQLISALEASPLISDLKRRGKSMCRTVEFNNDKNNWMPEFMFLPQAVGGGKNRDICQVSFPSKRNKLILLFPRFCIELHLIFNRE
jgi:hypothetical protein